MGLILDTSAVIGWVELQPDELVDYLIEAAGEETPAIHAVTLGELERGVRRAGDAVTRRTRLETLAFARDELDVVPLDPRGEQPALFGLLAASMSRKISHNDCWVTAAAVELHGTLITQDEQLAIRLNSARRQVGSPIAEWLAKHAPDFDVVHIAR